jgi:hypothetical protein
MNNRLFDEHIKEKFSDYAPDVPAYIWNRIAADRNRRKPVGFWTNLFSNKKLLVLIAVMIASGAGAWYFIQSTNNKEKTPVTIAQKNNTVSATTNSVDQTSVTTNNTSANDVTITSSSPNVSKGNTTPQTRSNAPYYVAASDQKINDAVRSTRSSLGNKTKTTITNSVAEEDEAANTEPAVEGTLMGRLFMGVEKFASLNRKGNYKLSQAPFDFFPGCPDFEKDAAANKKYISIYAGPDIALRSFSDTGNSAYMQKRKESTKVTSAYSAGISFTKVFANSISVKAGANFSQINEKFTYSQGNIVQVTYLIDVNGDTTGSYITTGSIFKTTHNKYRSVDIPLTVGYEMGNGKFHANVNAGVVVNVYSWQRGEVLDTSYQPVSITTGKGSSAYQFKTNAGLGVTAGVALYYKLNDNIHLMAEPYFRYNLKPISAENLTLKQKYNTVGLRVGVRMDLH